MDLQVSGLENLEERVGDALDRINGLQAGTQVDSNAFFSQQFMRDHTTFDSFAAFRTESPWVLDHLGDMQAVSSDQLDEYVAETTEFETWEGMKTQAAEEEIIDRIVP